MKKAGQIDQKRGIRNTEFAFEFAQSSLIDTEMFSQSLLR
jgi:hypothetical protein